MVSSALSLPLPLRKATARACGHSACVCTCVRCDSPLPCPAAHCLRHATPLSGSRNLRSSSSKIVRTCVLVSCRYRPVALLSPCAVGTAWRVVIVLHFERVACCTHDHTLDHALRMNVFPQTGSDYYQRLSKDHIHESKICTSLASARWCRERGAAVAVLDGDDLHGCACDGLSVCMCVYLSVSLSACLSVCLSLTSVSHICLSVRVSSFGSVCWAAGVYVALAIASPRPGLPAYPSARWRPAGRVPPQH
jgi:hypothetical protein